MFANSSNPRRTSVKVDSLSATPRGALGALLRHWLLPLFPFLLFALLYSSMNLLPNYRVNRVDIEGVYLLERTLFPLSAQGIKDSEGVFSQTDDVTPCEWCYAHHIASLDILSGCFYLLWVPLPILFCLFLCWRRQSHWALRFSTAFLVVNLVGFAGYYIHPSAPPWYVMFFGTEFVADTPGNMAGFARFDALTHTTIFHSIYEKNANVFAAIPSLHAAYNPVAAFYAWKSGHRRFWFPLLCAVSVGICLSAVYSAHHYIIDVLLGLLTALIGMAAFETCLPKNVKTHCCRR